MANGTTMNAALFEALRDAGIDEEKAAKVAKTIPPADTIATKAELKDLRAAIPNPDAFPSKAEVEVLKAEASTTKSGIERILEVVGGVDKRLEEVKKQFDRRLSGVEKTTIRTDERTIADRKFFFIIMAALAGLFLKDLFLG